LRHFRLLIKGAGLADIKLSVKSDGELFISCHLQAIGRLADAYQRGHSEGKGEGNKSRRVRRIYIPLGFEENLLYIVVINNVNIFFLHGEPKFK